MPFSIRPFCRFPVYCVVSTHNLHTVYEKFTGLECLLGKVETRDYAGNTHTTSRSGHEEHSPTSVPVHDRSLACHIDHSSDSDIANEARTSHLPSSSDADRAALQHVDHIRQKHGCSRLPPLQIVVHHTIGSSYAQLHNQRLPADGNLPALPRHAGTPVDPSR